MSDSGQHVVTSRRLTKSEHQRADYEREAARSAVVPSEAIPGRWYHSSQWGRVLCCGTGDPAVWVAAFAIRNKHKRTELKSITDDSETLAECKQSW